MFTEAQIAERCRALGPVRALTAHRGGTRNAVWLVTTDTGRFAVKSTIRTENQVRWVADLMDVARKSGLATPRLVADESGAFIVRGLTIETWIDGVQATCSDRAALAPALKAVRRATSHWKQRPGFVAAIDARPTTVAGDLDMPGLPPDLADICLAAWAALGSETAIIHGDVYEENVIRMPGGGLALIDWDEARRDHPGFDRLHTGEEESEALRRAHMAWEAAIFWHRDPGYAQRCASRLSAPGASIPTP